MKDLYNKVEQFVISSFTEIGKQHQLTHFLRTVYWIKQLRPNADEALLISAVAHDIERASRGKEISEKKRELGLTNKEFFRYHEEKGAEIIADFLKENGADKELIDRVKKLVSKHEEGGDEDQNLLKDADSLSFFENSAGYFLSEKKIADVGGIQRTKEKIDWMYNRISSKKAKQIAKKWYKETKSKLEKIT